MAVATEEKKAGEGEEVEKKTDGAKEGTAKEEENVKKKSGEKKSIVEKTATCSKESKEYVNRQYPSFKLEQEKTEKEKKPVEKEIPKGARVKQLIQISCDEAGRVNRPIEDEPYYHGFMSRDECSLLKKDGEFLVRKTEVGGHVHYVLSISQSKIIRNYLIKRTNKKRLFWVYDYAFKTVSDLIQYHYRNREPISEDGVLLLKPCFKQDWQLNHEQVERTKKLGSGAFGEVFQGTLQISPFRPKIPVAIKTLHTGNMSSDERIKFLKEANLMLQLNHINVVKFHGVATAKEPIMIVMELANGGSLLDRVKGTEHANTEADRVNYVYGAAKGLEYLEVKHIIHRDIAARNCLIGDHDEVKISDFGLSLLGAEYREKKMKNVPIRWLAPETLKKGTYNFKTDVYSFSVLIYEIYSNGKCPFDHVDNNKELRKLIITNKISLSLAAESIPDEMDVLRKKCGDFDPDKRPTFAEAVEIIKEMEGARDNIFQNRGFFGKIMSMFGH